MRVFISYSSKDRPKVQSFATDIERAGHEVWFDQELSGGQEWWDQILENIRHCDLFLLTLTHESVNSHACELEYTYALDLGKNFVPVLLEDVSTDLIPHKLQRFQYVNYTNRTPETALALSRAFTLLPPPRPLPSPLPIPPEVPITYKKIYQIRQRVIHPLPMDLEEQRNIHLDLKQMLSTTDKSTEEYTNLFDTLHKLRNRSDLFASVDREIAETFTQLPSPKAGPSRGREKTPADSSSRRTSRRRIPLFGLGTLFSPTRIHSLRGIVIRLVIVTVPVFILLSTARTPFGTALIVAPIIGVVIFGIGLVLFYLGGKIIHFFTAKRQQ
jgi:hypothetical protein